MQIGVQWFEISCGYYLIIELNLKLCKFKGQNDTKYFAVTLYLHFIYRINGGSTEFENCIGLRSAIMPYKSTENVVQIFIPHMWAVQIVLQLKQRNVIFNCLHFSTFSCILKKQFACH